MAKEIRKFKLSELICTVPEKGQYENLPYDYSDLKQSLIDKGYKLVNWVNGDLVFIKTNFKD